MNRYDPERPSIFARPDEDVDAPPRTTPETRTSSPPIRGAPPPRPVRPFPPPEEARPGLGRQAIILGSMGLAILALGGFIVASLFRDDPAVGLVGASASASATASIAVSATPAAADSPAQTEAPTPIVTAEPTPEPTPAGPPAVVAVGGWATVVTEELNVRDAAGLDARRVYGLVRGAIVHVADGPVEVEGRNWYRVASLGGAAGWSTSGSEASPFLRTVSRGGDFLHCGPVTSAVFADGALRPIEVLRIGEVALPGDAFDGGALGSLELVRALGADACVAAVLGPDGMPRVHADVASTACGRPVVAGDAIQLHPRAGMDVVAEYQVRDVAVIHPELLDPLAHSDLVTDNLRAVLALAAQHDRAWGCIHHNASGTATGSGGIQLDFRMCAVIELVTEERIEVRAPAAAEVVVFHRPAAHVDGALSVGVGSPVIVWGFDGRNERYVQIAAYGEPMCP